MNDEFRAVMSKLQTRVSLKFADCKESQPNDLNVDPEEIVVMFQFSEKGFGFGNVTIKQTPAGVFIDTECMSLDRVKKYLALFVDSAITDNDQDPEKHALFNRTMGRSCGERCKICSIDVPKRTNHDFDPNVIGGSCRVCGWNLAMRYISCH